MIYFTLNLDRQNRCSYEIADINYDPADFKDASTIFYAEENIAVGDYVDFWKLSTFNVYSGNAYKILDSNNNIATVINYDDVCNFCDYITDNIQAFVIRIDYLTYLQKQLSVRKDETSKILCDICEIDIPTY